MPFCGDFVDLLFISFDASMFPFFVWFLLSLLCTFCTLLTVHSTFFFFSSLVYRALLSYSVHFFLYSLLLSLVCCALSSPSVVFLAVFVFSRHPPSVPSPRTPQFFHSWPRRQFSFPTILLLLQFIFGPFLSAHRSFFIAAREDNSDSPLFFFFLLLFFFLFFFFFFFFFFSSSLVLAISQTARFS
jgi:hypothetical protein